jgi:steroid delta-isomerase-like uncharacterized protein
MREDVRPVVMGWTEMLNRHDPDGAAAFVAEDCAFINVGSGQRFVGRPAVREDFGALFAMWSEIHIEVTHYFDDGANWTGEWTMSGVHTGDVPGLPATGCAFRITGVGVGRVRGGELVRISQYWNMAEFLTQVGILPATPR